MENYIVSGSQKQPGAARSGGTARNSQRQPDPARSSQEQSGAARGSHKQPAARSRQEQPEAATSNQQQPGAARASDRGQKDSQKKRPNTQGAKCPKGFPGEAAARTGRATGPKRIPRRNRSEARASDGAQKDSQKKQQRGQGKRRGPKGFPEETAARAGRATGPKRIPRRNSNGDRASDGPKRIPWVRAVPQKKRPNARSPNGFPEEAAARTGSATCSEKSKLRGHALRREKYKKKVWNMYAKLYLF